MIIRNTGTDCCGPTLMVYSKGVQLQLRLWVCDGTERIIPMLEAGPVSVLSWSEQQGPGLLCTSGRGQAARWHHWVASMGGPSRCTHWLLGQQD